VDFDILPYTRKMFPLRFSGRYLAVASVVGLLCQSLRATQTQVHRQDSTFRAGGEEVLLDVIARDKKGRPVTTLKSGDIAVFDNGVSRKISSFRLVQGGDALILGADAAAPASKQVLDPMRQIRLMTLIFNRLDSVSDRAVARNAALDLVMADLPENVFMSVWVLDQNLKALQPFTADRDRLRNAIEKATSGGYTQFDAASRQILQQLENQLGPSTSGLSPEEQAIGNGTAGNSGPGAATSAQASPNKAMAQIMLNTLQLERTSAINQAGRAAVMGLLDAVREQYRLSGRKSIFFFSDGFSLPQGMEENFRTVISTANRFNVTFYSIDAHGLSTSAQNDAANAELAGAAAASRNQASRSTTVTPQMARATDNAIESGRSNTQNYLAELADSTGGFLMANKNDFRSDMGKAVEDIETYYELTYNPEIEKYDGSFRSVLVKTDRPGVKLVSRAGYFALPRAVGVAEVFAPFEVPLLNALNSTTMVRDLDFHTAGMHFRDAKQSLCAVVLDLPLKDLTFQRSSNEAGGKQKQPEETRYQAVFAYLILLKDQQGTVVKAFRATVPLTPRGDQLEALKQSHFFYTQHFPLAPGLYTLQTAVMDRKADRLGTRKVKVFIPAGSSLGISSISLVRSIRDKTDLEAESDPFAAQGKIITPTLSSINKSQKLSLYAVIYTDSQTSEKPVLAVQFNRDGQPLGGGSPELGVPDETGRIQYVATVPLDKFQPGNYEVRFQVKQGAKTAEETATFTIEN
jgi:VWFA-related protein